MEHCRQGEAEARLAGKKVGAGSCWVKRERAMATNRPLSQGDTSPDYFFKGNWLQVDHAWPRGGQGGSGRPVWREVLHWSR